MHACPSPLPLMALQRSFCNDFESRSVLNCPLNCGICFCYFPALVACSMEGAFPLSYINMPPFQRWGCKASLFTHTIRACVTSGQCQCTGDFKIYFCPNRPVVDALLLSTDRFQDHMNPLPPWVLCCQLLGVSFFLTGILELTVLAVLAFYPLL